jgi:hypothetical protein
MKNLYFKTDNLLHIILKFILFFIIALYPLYIFPSGSIQISHFLLLIFSISVLILIDIPLDKYFHTFLLFLIYSFVVNVFYVFYDIYVFEYNNLKYLKGILFLSFNFIITISLISFFNHQKKFNVIFYGLVTALAIIIFSYFYQFFFGSLNYRFQSFFNNPNQLGYFSVCSFSIVYLFYRNFYISYYLMIGLSIFLVLLSILTLSKAAFISLFLCVLFIIKPYNYKYSKIIILIFLLSIFFFITFFYLQITETNFFYRFINTLNESDSSMEVRGYFVYLEANFLEAIFGIGPNKVHELRGYEIHSTFMMILTSYGLIGFLIFSLLMLYWALDIKKSYGLNGLICICAPSLLYGLTHNGIRFSMFWIVFAVSIALSKEIINQKKFRLYKNEK